MVHSFEEFRVDMTNDGGCATLHVRGDLDLATAPVLAARLSAATQSSAGDVVVDLSQVDFLDDTAPQQSVSVQTSFPLGVGSQPQLSVSVLTSRSPSPPGGLPSPGPLSIGGACSRS